MRKKMDPKESNLDNLQERIIFVRLCEIIETLRGEQPSVTNEQVGERWFDEDSATTGAGGEGTKAQRKGDEKKRPGRTKGEVSRKVNGANYYLANRGMEAAFQTEGDLSITPAGRFLWQQWAAQMIEEEKLRDVLKKPTVNQTRVAPLQKTLRVAADDTVRCGLLMHVADAFHRECPGVELALREVTGPSTFAAPGAGLLDVAFGWDVPSRLGVASETVTLQGTEVVPWAVFRSGHPLAAGEGTDRIGIASLNPYPLVYPPIPSLREMLEVSRSASKPLIAMELPAIGYYLATTHAVGIVPGWPWVVRDLRRRFGLRTIPLDAPGAEVTNPSYLKLVVGAAARRADDSIRRFLCVAQDTLRALGTSDWNTERSALDPIGLSGRWHYYYVTRGPDARRPIPMWAVAHIDWQPDRIVGDTLAGTLLFHAPFRGEEWRLDVSGEIIPWCRVGAGAGEEPHHSLVIRCRHAETKEPAVATFYRRIRGESVGNHCLVGINVFTTIAGKLTASPALLSDREIDEPTRLAFVRQELVDLTSPDIVIEAAPMETFDGRR